MVDFSKSTELRFVLVDQRWVELQQVTKETWLSLDHTLLGTPAYYYQEAGKPVDFWPKPHDKATIFMRLELRIES
jgi:hypothetical protein